MTMRRYGLGAAKDEQKESERVMRQKDCARAPILHETQYSVREARSGQNGKSLALAR
jgi:hypothetical protein